MNRTGRVELRAGWLHLGESQGRAVARAIVKMNTDGYKVVFITEDKWSLGKRIGNFLLSIISLGFRVRRPSVLLVGELIAPIIP